MNAKKIFRNVTICIGCFIFLCCLSYLCLSLFFSYHFFYDATINNIPVSRCNVESANNAMISNEKSYELSISTNNKTYSIKASDIDFKYDVSKKEITDVLSKQNSWLWFVPGKHDYKINANVSYDEKKLKKVLASFSLNKSRKKPVDAYIVKEDSDFVIKNEVLSDYLDENKVFEVVKTALDNMDVCLDLEVKDYYTVPQNTYKTLYPALCQLRNLLQKKISFTCVYEKVEVSKEKVCDFLLYENSNIGFNIEEITKYVDKISEKHDTLYKTRTFTTSDNKKVEVAPGNYGWLIDKDSMVEEIKKSLLSDGNTYEFDAKYTSTGFKTEASSNDIGSTYIEISISKQHMWLYDKEKLVVETDVVTGNKDGSHDTPKGVWYVWSKQSPAVLVGDDYRTTVSYWMAIDNTGVGIHDSSWRFSSEYGGNTYTYNGSHGCINTPYDIVKKIYNNVDVGIPVVIY